MSSGLLAVSPCYRMPGLSDRFPPFPFPWRVDVTQCRRHTGRERTSRLIHAGTPLHCHKVRTVLSTSQQRPAPPPCLDGRLGQPGPPSGPPVRATPRRCEARPCGDLDSILEPRSAELLQLVRQSVRSPHCLARTAISRVGRGGVGLSARSYRLAGMEVYSNCSSSHSMLVAADLAPSEESEGKKGGPHAHGQCTGHTVS